MKGIVRAMWVVAVTALAASAAAQEKADSERLYKEGWRLYQAKQYDEACPLLERSVAAAATIRTRGALALCYEGAGRFASAYRAWKAVADLAREAGAVEQSRMKRALQKVDELAPRIANVVFQVAEAPAGLQVALDGHPLGAAELGVPVPVDPGAHTLEARAPERIDWRSSFELGASDEGKTRSLPVGPLLPIQRVEHVEVPSTPRAVPQAPPPERHKTPTLRYVGLATAGAGLVSIGVGTFFALSAKSKWQDAKDMGCDKHGVCETQAGADLVSSAGSRATIGTVGFVAGVVLVAGGAALWFFTPSGEHGPAVAPSVSVGPGGAQLGLAGSF